MLVSSPYRYSNNEILWKGGKAGSSVSSPYRYSNNNARVENHPQGIIVSSPYRYSNNDTDEYKRMNTKVQFQVLIGILTIILRSSGTLQDQCFKSL